MKIRASFAFQIAALLSLFCMPLSAFAERALIVTNAGYPSATGAVGIQAKADDLTETLLGLDYDLRRASDPSIDEFNALLDELYSEAGPVLVYFAGRTFADGEATRLMLTDGQSVSLQIVMARIGAGRRPATAVFLDGCSARQMAATDGIQQDGMGRASIASGVLLAAAVAPGADCADTPASPVVDALLDRLQIPGLDAQQLFAETPVAQRSSLTRPYVFRPVDSGKRLSAEDYAFLDTLSAEGRAQMLALWTEAGVIVDQAGAGSQSGARVATAQTRVIASPLAPVIANSQTLAPAAQTVARVSGGIALTPASTQAVSLASNVPQPARADLPRPSIIIGRETVQEAAFDTAAAPTGPVSGASLDYEDVEARRKLREDDPALFASLVETGAFDPPAATLVVALQTELQRMNCYTSRIDGQWGPGSRRSVVRYYEQLGAAAPSQDPDMATFRQIMLRDDVTCPVVAAAPARRTTTRSTPRRATPQRSTAPPRRATPAPAPAPAPQQPQRRINRNTGTGIFR